MLGCSDCTAALRVTRLLNAKPPSCLPLDGSPQMIARASPAAPSLASCG